MKLFIVKNFWPRRPQAKGFSRQNLTYKYPEKTNILSTDKISNELLTDRNLKSQIEDTNQLEIAHLLRKREHWANRDFSEYREVS